MRASSNECRERESRSENVGAVVGRRVPLAEPLDNPILREGAIEVPPVVELPGYATNRYDPIKQIAVRRRDCQPAQW